MLYFADTKLITPCFLIRKYKRVITIIFDVNIFGKKYKHSVSRKSE
jgi:hypothetical protein